MRTIHPVLLFGAACAATFLVFTAATAQSAHLRLHGESACQHNDGKAVNYSNSFYVMTDELLCPFPSTNALPHDRVRTINVHGHRGSASARSIACATDPWTYTSTCGNQTQWGYNNAAFNLDVSAWSDPHDFAYVQHDFFVTTSSAWSGEACSHCILGGIYAAD